MKITAICLLLIFTAAFSACSLIPGLGETTYEGKPDSRFTGTWVQELSGEYEDYSGMVKLTFTSTGTLEYSVDTSKIPLSTTTEAQTTENDDGSDDTDTDTDGGTNIEIPNVDVSEIVGILNSLSSTSVATLTYEIVSDTEITITPHSALIDFFGDSSSESMAQTLTYSFDGDVLILDGIRYVRVTEE